MNELADIKKSMVSIYMKGSDNMQNRFKSWALWLSVAALIAFVTKTWLNFEIPQFDMFVELILTVLAGFGIINNPTDKEHL